MGSLRLPDFFTDQVFLLSKVCKLNCYTSPFFRWVGTNWICTTNLQSLVYSHWLTPLSLILVSVSLSTRHITVSKWSIPAAECRGVIWWEQLINMVHNEQPGSLAYSSLLACKQLASYLYIKQFNVQSAIKWKMQHMTESFIGQRQLLYTDNNCEFLGENRLFLKMQVKSFCQFIHSKMLWIVYLHIAVPPSWQFARAEFGCHTVQLLFWEVAHWFSLCKFVSGLDMFCSCSLIHAATASWSFCNCWLQPLPYPIS